MNRATVWLVDANSCIKLCMIVMVFIGIVVGVGSFVASFFGFDPDVRVIDWNLHGIPGGIAAVFVAPFLGAVFALPIGVLACIMLNLGLRVLKGIEVRGVWDAPR